jgi:hypothetical protein
MRMVFFVSGVCSGVPGPEPVYPSRLAHPVRHTANPRTPTNRALKRFLTIVISSNLYAELFAGNNGKSRNTEPVETGAVQPHVGRLCSVLGKILTRSPGEEATARRGPLKVPLGPWFWPLVD